MNDDTARDRIALETPRCTDAIDSLMPREVATPTSLEELGERLAEANRMNNAVVLAGNRSKISWGQPPERLDLVINTKKLPHFIEHAASDLVVRVSASVDFDELQSELARANQRLAVDSVVPNSTVGGVIATGISGPLRYGFGAVRDLIIGITVLRANGVRASSGGRVVKNVAGYDLAKLYTGSYGTLGAITEAFFRLHALPERSHYVIGELDLGRIDEALGQIRRAPLALSAIEVNFKTDDDHATVGLLVEGQEQSVVSRTAMAKALFGSDPSVTDLRPSWWGRLPGTTTFKLTTEIAAVGDTLRAIQQIARDHGQSLHLAGSAGVGVIFLGAEFDETLESAQADSLVRAIREVSTRGGGSTVVLAAPAAIRAAVDVWGPIPAISVMRRIKKEFDPNGVLAPGRFVGGI